MKDTGRILLLLLSLGLLFAAAGSPAALAQDEGEPTGFKGVTLWVYPEYDDPGLLVMLEGQIDGAAAPAPVRFLVPDAGRMYSAGSKDAQGVYSGGPPREAPSDIPGWKEISYEAASPTFRVEYYDPVIPAGPEKSISYDFRVLYPVEGLEVIVQQPLAASNFSVAPAGAPRTGADGFNYFTYNYDKLEAGETLHFDIAYTKSDPNPSLAPPAGGSASPGATSSSGTTAAIIAGAVLVVLLAGFFWIRGGKQPRTRAERRQMARNTGARRPAPGQGKARFCSQCGQPVDGKFCASCGTRVS